MALPAQRNTEVLIIGAGPSGLVLALWLKRLGVEVRIIDKTAEPGTTSRALAVHARTLEFYRQVGISDEVVEHGLKFAAINLWARGARRARVSFADIGTGLSPFPYVLIFPQDQHERLLIEHLRRAGVEVERRTQLLGFREVGDAVDAQLELEDGARADCEAAFIVGCDGAHSRVRDVLAVGFPGGTYDHVFYVADVGLHGPTADHELHLALDDADILAIFPMKGDNVARLIGTVTRSAAQPDQPLSWDDVSQGVLQRLKMTIDKVHWFSTYRVHHRVAEHFGVGRSFLLGDAAHIHSPVGGQGMNTGIGDAINLAWKLAAVLQRRAHAALLDTYEPERIAFAKRLVATTDKAFTLVTEFGPLARLVRLDVIPRVAPLLMGPTVARRFMFKTVSQILVNYRHGRLSEGRAGSVSGGDRLPWVQPEQASPADNFTPLSSLDWQVHCYGAVAPELKAACAARALPLHAFAWGRGAQEAGLARDAAYLVRPDGYVALADASASAEALAAYLELHGFRVRAPSP
jgi:2-polyprenyl-6-methoxyphenol hydroxylase-like FAD-dependent oxidoreductase